MKNRFFDLDELFAEVRQSRMFSQRFENILTFKLNNLRELCGRLPENGEAFFIETRKSFTAFTFIVYLIKNAGHVSHLYIATYSTNERIIHLHVSETLKFRMPEIFQRLKQLNNEGIITLTYGWTHKKVTCLDTESGHYVVEGSGNYGENALEEQYVFLKSKKVYEFRIGN